MKRACVAVIQFPGVNCETESVRALERVGLAAEVFRSTRRPAELHEYQAYVLPGGFSYQDRVRAGALAAKDPLVELLADQAEQGKPVLGICNGAQILIESGMVPDGRGIELALARNRMPDRTGYYARWIYLRVEPSPCVFTRALEAGTVLPLPVAHGEGRFVGEPGRLAALLRSGQVPLRYAHPNGNPAERFPANPNGSEEAVAAVCNHRGNVLALMPHPERAQDRSALPRRIVGAWSERRERGDETSEDERVERGPGLTLFEGLRRYLSEA